jgi:hypothetical protein
VTQTKTSKQKGIDMKGSSNPRGGFMRMEVHDAARIYSSTARQNGGVIPKGSFAARAMSAATRPSPSVQTGGPTPTGK